MWVTSSRLIFEPHPKSQENENLLDQSFDNLPHSLHSSEDPESPQQNRSNRLIRIIPSPMRGKIIVPMDFIIHVELTHSNQTISDVYEDEMRVQKLSYLQVTVIGPNQKGKIEFFLVDEEM